MSQAFSKAPSELYGVAGAAGFCFDRGIFLFGKYVEGEMSEAENRASNAMFARSNRARAFARCMGDDMETSTAGFADPFATGAVGTRRTLEGTEDVAGPTLKRRVKKDEEAKDEILWVEGGVMANA
jgi:hypothetical protein